MCKRDCTLNPITGWVTLSSNNWNQAFSIPGNESFTPLGRNAGPWLFLAELLPLCNTWGGLNRNGLLRSCHCPPNTQWDTLGKIFGGGVTLSFWSYSTYTHKINEIALFSNSLVSKIMILNQYNKKEFNYYTLKYKSGIDTSRQLSRHNIQCIVSNMHISINLFNVDTEWVDLISTNDPYEAKMNDTTGYLLLFMFRLITQKQVRSSAQ